MNAAAAATASMFVVAAPWSRAWRAPLQIWRDQRFLQEQADIAFSVTGYTCGGSGTRDLGATLSLRRQVALVEWRSPDVAVAGTSALVQRWEDRGASVWFASLVPLRSHGSMRGATPFLSSHAEPETSVPTAVLSYGKVRVTKMFTWYERALPKAQRAAALPTSGMLAGLGFTDLPMRHACTFSFWQGPESIAKYSAGKSSGHSGVRTQSISDHWFTESLFARFAVVDHGGSWSGGDPLA